METEINNAFYDELGERWYTADDDPVALLRAEGKLKSQWISSWIKKNIRETQLNILDVGCGAGIITNALYRDGFEMTGIDLSKVSLEVAKQHRPSENIRYQQADAYHLPFESMTFDIVMSLDFLEHVDRPEAVIQECARVLKPGGHFFYHTFNRNLMSNLIVIKGIEWFVKNTPEKMHVIDLFITPKELHEYCKNADLTIRDEIGIRPRFNAAFFKMLKTKTVPKEFQFKTTSSTLISYLGVAQKY